MQQLLNLATFSFLNSFYEFVTFICEKPDQVCHIILIRKKCCIEKRHFPIWCPYEKDKVDDHMQLKCYSKLLLALVNCLQKRALWMCNCFSNPISIKDVMSKKKKIKMLCFFFNISKIARDRSDFFFKFLSSTKTQLCPQLTFSVSLTIYGSPCTDLKLNHPVYLSSLLIIKLSYRVSHPSVFNL